MPDFIAFDVETPNRWGNRICSIGLSYIQNGAVAWTKNYLINPETAFDIRNSWIHGIYEEDVAQCPAFPEVWREIRPLFFSGVAVAHNAAFDLRVLRQTLASYDIEEPPLSYVCTLCISRREIKGLPNYRLPTLCQYVGCDLLHHDSGSDSRGCAEILCFLLRRGLDVGQYIRKFSLTE